MNSFFLENFEKLEIINYIIDLIYDSGKTILYEKYIDNKISDYIGNYYAKHLIEPMNHLLFECDRGENKQDLKNWLDEPFPTENKIDNWASYRLKIKKKKFEKQRKKTLVINNNEKIKSIKNLNDSNELSEKNFEVNQEIEIKKSKKYYKKQNTIFKNEINIRKEKDNKIKLKKDELNYFNRKKEEENYKIKKKKELEKKLNKKDFIFDNKGNIIFLKNKKNYDDNLSLAEINEVKFNINKEKYFKNNSLNSNPITKTLNYQEVENVFTSNNKIQIFTPKEELSEFKEKVNKLPIINEIIEMEKGVTYKIEKRIIKKGEKINLGDKKISRSDFKILVNKKNMANNAKNYNIQENKNIEKASMKDSMLRKSIISLKEDIEKGLKGVLFINPNLLINFLKDLEDNETIKDEEKIKRKLKRKENKIIYQKFNSLFKKNPEKFINRVITFQNDIVNDKNFKSISNTNKISFTKFQKKLLEFNKDIINDKNRINNSYIDPKKRKILNTPLIPAKQLGKNIYKINTISNVNLNTKSIYGTRNLNIGKSGLLNYFNNYSLLK